MSGAELEQVGFECVTLMWTATAGNHDWRVEVWEDGKLEDSRSGKIRVEKSSSSTCLSGVPLEGHLEVYPEWVEAGDSVSVHITVTNLDPNCAHGPFNIELVDDSGAKWWPKKDTEYGCSGCGYVIQDGALKIYAGKTMSDWTDFSNIGQDTTLYLKVGGKTLASAKINVKQDRPVKANMECKPAVVPLDGSTTCTVHFELRSAETITLNLEEVDFGGKKVWPNGPSSVTVNKQTVTLTPTNMQEDLTVTINIDDELADYYFKKSPWLSTGSYKDRLVGYSYLIRAVFNGNVVVSDIIEITGNPQSVGENAETAVKAAGIANSVLQKVAEHTGQLETVAGGPLGKVVAKVTPVLDFISWSLTARDVINWLRAPTPSDEDNNNVIAG
ncbi:hypothetical protein FH039_04915 [Thermococcus indicus]|uniref:Uncharacterized protein n=1 Tax=Thermococcus indicus TaxID=2586643 RepID=A0A4Y5SJL6_9EURY|nr:hypothetical protein [Thermococcus indicus]QDA31078.1 hypothetical protein FH039_04915 [Thermococcus indicus]